MKLLIVVDMQNDFIDGSLGTKEAVSIVNKVKEKIQNFDGKVIFTRDTHSENYLKTNEGRNLPVVHCVEDTEGWQISKELQPFVKHVINKPTFGSTKLAQEIKALEKDNVIESIELVGLCTDICVVSNALLLKANFPEVEISVDASCCAGVTIDDHLNALKTMKQCQIQIINEK